MMRAKELDSSALIDTNNFLGIIEINILDFNWKVLKKGILICCEKKYSRFSRYHITYKKE